MKYIGDKFTWQGMLIATILGIMGMCFLFFSGIFSITNYNDLYECISVSGLEIIIGIFFIVVFLYCWLLFIRNVIVKPKQEVLYLESVEDDICEFISNKGKIYYFLNENFEIGKFYDVLKTYDHIKQVLNISKETFEIKKKKRSYWLNFYSPFGNYENLFLLPIVYVVLLPGILSIIMSKGWQKIYGIIIVIFPLYVIIYDLIYKYKLSRDSEFNITLMLKLLSMLKNIIKLIAVIFVNVIFIWLLIHSSELIEKLIISPFCLCGLCLLGFTIAQVIKNEKLKTIFHKSYIVIFLLYFYGILTFGAIDIIKAKEYAMLFFTIPFWLCGIYIIYDFFIK